VCTPNSTIPASALLKVELGNRDLITLTGTIIYVPLDVPRYPDNRLGPPYIRSTEPAPGNNLACKMLTSSQDLKNPKKKGKNITLGTHERKSAAINPPWRLHRPLHWLGPYPCHRGKKRHSSQERKYPPPGNFSYRLSNHNYQKRLVAWNGRTAGVKGYQN